MLREFIEWSDYWWVKAGNAEISRIALVGDSITRSYYDDVNRLLADEGRPVDRFTTSHFVGDRAFLAELEYIFGPVNGYRYEVIHFNNGLHGGCNDTRLPFADYEKGMREAIALLRRLQPQAKLILVTSTNMVRSGAKEDEPDEAYNDFILERNALVHRLGKEFGLPVDDLYQTVAWKAEYPHRDGVHFGPDGVKALADQVSAVIRKQLHV